jgi:hypothetical protein
MKQVQQASGEEIIFKRTPARRQLLPVLSKRLVSLNLANLIQLSIREKSGNPRLCLERLRSSGDQFELISEFVVGFRHAADICRAIEGTVADRKDRIIRMDCEQQLLISLRENEYGATMLNLERQLPSNDRRDWRTKQRFSCALQHAPRIVASLDDLLVESNWRSSAGC